MGLVRRRAWGSDRRTEKIGFVPPNSSRKCGRTRSDLGPTSKARQYSFVRGHGMNYHVSKSGAGIQYHDSGDDLVELLT